MPKPKPIKYEVPEEAQKDILAKTKDSISYEEQKFRVEMWNAYMRKGYGKVKDGESSYVASSVRDTVEMAYAQIMDLMLGDDRPFQFLPIKADDEVRARQETDIVNHIVQGKHSSFAIMANWVKSGLIYGNAYIQVSLVKKARVDIQRHKNIADMEKFNVILRLLKEKADSDPDMNYWIEKAEGVIGKEDADGVMAWESITDKDGNPEKISLRIRTETFKEEIEIESVPQEELHISKGWHKVSLKDCPCVVRRVLRTRSDLDDMGFDRKQIKSLKTATKQDGTLKQAREATENNDNYFSDTELQEVVAITESYVQVFNEESEKPRLYRAFTDGDGKVILKYASGELAVEEVDRNPYICWTPIPCPDRHIGIGYAEMAAPIQRKMTAYWRAFQTNMAKTIHPRPIINENALSDTTIADMQNPQFGAGIFVDGLDAINYIQQPSILNEISGGMELSKTELEMATGAYRHAEGLDFKSLEKTNVGSEGVSRAMDAAQSRMAGTARAFVEYGLRELAIEIHRLLRESDMDDLSMMIRGELVETNPNDWVERSDLEVRVGSGRSDKAEKIQRLMFLAQKIEAGLTAGFPGITEQHLHNVNYELFETMGIRGLEKYSQSPDKMDKDALAAAKAPPEPNPLEQANLTLANAEDKKADVAKLKADNDKIAKDQDHEFRMNELRSREITKLIELEISLVGAGVSAEESAARITKLKADTNLTDARTLETLIGKPEKDTKKAK